MTASTERAILAGGYFWGMQDLFRRQPGVISTRIGYTGGDVPNATYRNHGSHAEAVEIIFDPKMISYRRILEFFFQVHDPTTLNRQGNDRGTSYRSVIVFADDEQKRIATGTIADVNASGLWPAKVVTQLTPAGPFWEAEPGHQDYLDPSGYTCHFVRPDWKTSRAKRGEANRASHFFASWPPTAHNAFMSVSLAAGAVGARRRCNAFHRRDKASHRHSSANETVVGRHQLREAFR